jgi:hypothetical protein
VLQEHSQILIFACSTHREGIWTNANYCKKQAHQMESQCAVTNAKDDRHLMNQIVQPHQSKSTKTQHNNNRAMAFDIRMTPLRRATQCAV